MWNIKVRLLKRILKIQIDLDKTANKYMPNLYIVRRLIRELGELEADLKNWLEELEAEIK